MIVGATHNARNKFWINSFMIHFLHLLKLYQRKRSLIQGYYESIFFKCGKFIHTVHATLNLLVTSIYKYILLFHKMKKTINLTMQYAGFLNTSVQTSFQKTKIPAIQLYLQLQMCENVALPDTTCSSILLHMTLLLSSICCR